MEHLAETLYRIANNLDRHRNGLPDEWRDWINEISRDLRSTVEVARSLASPLGTNMKEKDKTTELEWRRRQMKAVEEYLNINWSNDMEWSDEIIIAIDQRASALIDVPPPKLQENAVYAKRGRNDPAWALFDRGTETKGHVHAQNMIEFGKDALTHKEPWKLWERSVDGVRWYPCNGNPTWVPEYKYRRKPRTININGHEVPEPLREVSGLTSVWAVELRSPGKCCLYSVNCTEAQRALERGLAHDTSEAAIAHAEALLSFTTTEEK